MLLLRNYYLMWLEFDNRGVTNNIFLLRKIITDCSKDPTDYQIIDTQIKMSYGSTKIFICHNF